MNDFAMEHNDFDQLTTSKEIIHPSVSLVKIEASMSSTTESSSTKSQLLVLLSLGSNQKPSGCLDLAIITAERATNCATEDGERDAASVDRTQYLQKSQD
jgi:hypothetical protein